MDFIWPLISELLSPWISYSVNSGIFTDLYKDQWGYLISDKVSKMGKFTNRQELSCPFSSWILLNYKSKKFPTMIMFYFSGLNFHVLNNHALFMP